MTIHQGRSPKAWLLLGAAAAACVAAPLPAFAQSARAQSAAFNVAAQDLGPALTQLGRESGRSIVFSADLVRGKRTGGYRGQGGIERALDAMLSGSGLTYRANASGGYVIVPAAGGDDRPMRRTRPSVPPPAAEAAPSREVTDVENVIVTARRMEERIIDVPVAVSAFSEKQLDDRKVEGGSELLRVVPNVNFSKDNFTGYNFSIRGIGTKAISVTTDPGVAVSFNNTALLRNRLFEQEYFDVERLEVLRGPQGTLYGRNATAGVVNMLPKLPELDQFSGSVQGELGNYDARRARGYINIPLGDQFAFRAAGAYTQRTGYDRNLVTERQVNGRDLWSARLGLLWKPDDRFSANLLWEHFEEDDTRARTGKQLCTRGETPTSLAWTDPSGKARTQSLTYTTNPSTNYWPRVSLTPGCQAKSLFTQDAFSAPNGIGFPIVTGMILVTPFSYRANTVPRDWGGYLFKINIDPFSSANGKQSSNLREIETYFDPVFRAKNDVIQLNVEAEVADGLTLYAQTLYMEDSYYGMQDYFRLNPQGGLIGCRDNPLRTPLKELAVWLGPCSGNTTDPFGGGTFVDPQLGTLDRLVALDLSKSSSKQWSQEIRVASSFDGPFNFNLGANYLKFSTNEDYYVFSNAFTIAAIGNNGTVWSGTCQPLSPLAKDVNECAYIDPNPIDRLDGQGHNYYRNINIAKTESWAVFGEGYYSVRDDLRLTFGLRYTNDKKTTTPIPTQLLGSAGTLMGTGPGSIGKGYPRYPDEVHRWGEWTGRLSVDWKPDLSFTDDTLVYASFSRGYKGGGANPRGPADSSTTNYTPLDTSFDPEFVNAYELGMKNALMGGRLMLSASAFYYDYKDYQVTQIIDRSLHNENFNAKVYGLEFETAWSPTRNFRMDATLGLLKTRIADGEKSIDIMNRTQGDPDWITLRPWPTSPATCIVPKDILGRAIAGGGNNVFIKMLCPGPVFGEGLFRDDPRNFIRDQWGAVIYDPLKYINPKTGVHDTNGGRGFAADLSGNSLPNAPKITFNIGAQYRIELPAGWDLTVRGDYYRQSESFMRVYNTEFDRLKSWGNANLSATLAHPGENLRVQVYVKNVFDETPITDGFTGPDETGNTTNVFTLDPRLVGISVRKDF